MSPYLKLRFVGFDKQHLVEVKGISTHDGVLIAGRKQMLFERVRIGGYEVFFLSVGTQRIVSKLLIIKVKYGLFKTVGLLLAL